MNEETNTRPAILIDVKKYRIRIHKQTLHMLSDPDYIQLLVNPEERTIALIRSVKTDPLAHRIDWEHQVKKKSFELYSRYLVCNLCKVCTEWKNNESYRIYGEFLPNEGIVRFCMDDSVSITNRS